MARSGHSADAYLIAGSTLLDLNEFEAARRDLEAALAIDPKLPRLYSLTGMARDKTGDIKGGEVAFREALKLNPDDFDANLYLGAILYRERNMDEAKLYLDRALRLDPKSAMARYESAMFESTAGQYEAAAQDLEKLIKEIPSGWNRTRNWRLYTTNCIERRMGQENGASSRNSPRNNRQRDRQRSNPCSSKVKILQVNSNQYG